MERGSESDWGEPQPEQVTERIQVLRRTRLPRRSSLASGLPVINGLGKNHSFHDPNRSHAASEYWDVYIVRGSPSLCTTKIFTVLDIARFVDGSFTPGLTYLTSEHRIDSEMNVIDHTRIPSPRRYNTYNNVKAWLTMRPSVVSGTRGWSRIASQAMSGARSPRA